MTMPAVDSQDFTRTPDHAFAKELLLLSREFPSKTLVALTLRQYLSRLPHWRTCTLLQLHPTTAFLEFGYTFVLSADRKIEEVSVPSLPTLQMEGSRMYVGIPQAHAQSGSKLFTAVGIGKTAFVQDVIIAEVPLRPKPADPKFVQARLEYSPRAILRQRLLCAITHFVL